MKRFTLVAFILIVLFILFFGVNSIADVHGDPELKTQMFSEPTGILLIGIGMISFGTMLKRRFGRS